MAAPLAAEDAVRLDTLVAVFTRIGDERMRDLALYNPALSVEAIGFRRWDGWLAGILVTPWFMNLCLLPDDPAALAGAEAGTKRKLAMPCGEVVMTVGEVEQIGKYFAHSIHSPMGKFGDHAAAATAAWAAVEGFFRAAGEPDSGECGFGWGVNKEY